MALAEAQMDKGSYDKARGSAERALEIQERRLAEHLDLAKTLNQLGVAHWYLGDLGTARRFLERSLAMSRSFWARSTPTWRESSTTSPSCACRKRTRRERDPSTSGPS